MATDDLKREFLAGFVAEAQEHLQTVEGRLLAIERAAERGAPSAGAVRDVFRAVHTLKGLAAMVDVAPIVAIAHVMEAVLREADRDRRPIAGDVEALLAGAAAIGQRVEALAAGRAVPAPPPGLLERLEALGGPGEASAAGPTEDLHIPEELAARVAPGDREVLAQGVAAGRRAVRVDFVPTPARAAAGETITTVRERLAEQLEIVKVVPLSRPAGPSSPGGLAFAIVGLTAADDADLARAVGVEPAEVVTLARRSPAPALAEDDDEAISQAVGASRAGWVRVDVARLDEALDRLADLVVTRFRLERAVEALREAGVDARELDGILADHRRQLRDLRGAIMRARLVSVAGLLERVPLIVRGLARTTGKRVRLEVEAGRAELDKGVAERVFPALVHLVRNAVDHGLEAPAERADAGKAEEGLVRVVCRERAGQRLELQVTDDGRGIDPNAVAARDGLPGADGAEELLERLCRPGLSTATRATETSGRGMGMDIVRRVVVDELGGELRLDTRLGRGTTFSLLVPLSITIVDAFAFEAGGQAFVVPIAAVEEIVAVDEAALVAAPARARGRADARLMARRGKAVPLLSLAAIFGLSRGEGPTKALVVRRGEARFAFEVDRMRGQQEVVVRPLEDPLVRVTGVSGATDLGDGRPTLVLDLPGLAGALTPGSAPRGVREVAA